MSSAPWQPPDFTFTNTSNGRTPSGIMLGSMLGKIITSKRRKDKILQLR